jgi:hypothetical protein
MNPEVKEVLERVENQLRENTKILRRIDRAYKWNLILKVVYWLVIIALAFGAYYIIQPYVEMIRGYTSL